MATIEYSDGTKIDFSGTPTQQDAEQAYNQVKGVTPQTQTTAQTPDTQQEQQPGILSRIFSALKGGSTAVANAVTGSEQKVGQIVGQSTAVNSQDFNNAVTSQQGLSDMQLKVVKQIQADKIAGKDTTNLQNLLNKSKGITNVDLANTIAPASQSSNAQALGALGGTALDIATAGLGAAGKGAETGSLLLKGSEEAANALPKTLGEAITKNTTTDGGLDLGEAISKNITSNVVKSTLADTLKKVGINVAKGAALGYGYDVAGSAQNDQTSFVPGLSTIAGTLGTVGAEVLSNVAKVLPKTIVRSILPKLQQGETLDNVLSSAKGLTTNSLIENSQKNIDHYGDTIQSMLSHPDVAATQITGKDFAQSIVDQFPHSEYSPNEIFSTLKKQLPSEAATISSLQKGSIGIEDANRLRTELNKISYTSKIDAPEVKAAKILTATAGGTLRDAITSVVPDVDGLLANQAKEIRLNQALNAVKGKAGTKVTVKDMLAAVSGYGYGGYKGAIEALLLERGLNSPGININVAKAINKAAPALSKLATVAPAAGKLANSVVDNNNNQ